MQEKIDKLVRPEIRALTAYHVPPANDLIKLDAMENPWSWSAELRAAWLHALQTVEINRYPDPAARELQTRMLDYDCDIGHRKGNMGDGNSCKSPFFWPTDQVT